MQHRKQIRKQARFCFVLFFFKCPILSKSLWSMNLQLAPVKSILRDSIVRHCEKCLSHSHTGSREYNLRCHPLIESGIISHTCTHTPMAKPSGALTRSNHQSADQRTTALAPEPQSTQCEILSSEVTLFLV